LALTSVLFQILEQATFSSLKYFKTMVINQSKWQFKNRHRWNRYVVLSWAQPIIISFPLQLANLLI